MPISATAAIAVLQRAIRAKLARKRVYKKLGKRIKKAGGVGAFKKGVAFRYKKWGVNRGRSHSSF